MSTPAAMTVIHFSTSDGLPSIEHKAFIEFDNATQWLEKEGFISAGDNTWHIPADSDDKWSTIFATVLAVTVDQLGPVSAEHEINASKARISRLKIHLAQAEQSLLRINNEINLQSGKIAKLQVDVEGAVHVQVEGDVHVQTSDMVSISEGNDHVFSTTGRVFQITEETRRSNENWPNWMHEAWNKDVGDMWSLEPATHPYSDGMDKLALGTPTGRVIIEWDSYLFKAGDGIYVIEPSPALVYSPVTDAD